MALRQTAVYSPAPLTERGKSACLTSSPRGDWLYFPSGYVVVSRSVQNPTQAKFYTQHSAAVTAVRVSPSGCYCASGDASGKVRIWATDNEDNTLKLEVQPLTGPVLDLAWSSDNQRVVAVGSGSERFAQVFLMDSGTTTGEVLGHSKVIITCDFKPTRPFRIVTGSEDMQLNFHEGPPFKFQKSFKSHTNFVCCARFSPDGNFVASTGSDKKIFILDAKTGDVVKELPSSHNGSVYSCSWSPDSKKLVTASADKTCALWDVENGSRCSSFGFEDPKAAEFMQVGVVFAGTQIVSLSLNGDLNFLDPNSPAAPIKTWPGHTKSVTSVLHDPSRKLTFSASSDGAILCWNADGVATRVKGKGHTSLISSMALLGNELVTAGMDDKIMRINIQSLQFDGVLASVKGGAVGIAAAPNRPGVAAVASTNTVYLLENGKNVSELAAPYTPLCVAFSKTGHIAVGGKDKAIHIYDGQGSKLSEIHKLADPQQGSAIQCVSFSADGQRLAAGDAARYIILWDLEGSSYKIHSPLLAMHTSMVKSVAFSVDGSHLVSGSVDCNVIVWDLKKDSKISTRAHTRGVNSVCFMGSELVGVSGGADGALCVWTVC